MPVFLRALDYVCCVLKEECDMWQCMDCVDRKRCWTFNSCSRYRKDESITPEKLKEIENDWEKLYQMLSMKITKIHENGMKSTIGFGAFYV